MIWSVATPFWGECEDETHPPEMGTWVSVGTPETSEFDCRGQNTSHCDVFYIIRKILKRRCRKWACMNHLDICITSYGKKKGRESNWQFDSRPLKVGNRPDPGACRWSANHHWKALDKSYKFASNLIPIGGLNKELWFRKLTDVQIGTVLGLLLGSPGIKKPFGYRCRGGAQRILYGGRWWLPSNPGCGESCESKVARGCPSTKGASESELINLLVGLMQVRVSK
jgi:hypothetical protein